MEINTTFVLHSTHIKMSALLRKLAGDATVRGTTTHDGIQAFWAFDSVNLACQKRNV